MWVSSVMKDRGCVRMGSVVCAQQGITCTKLPHIRPGLGPRRSMGIIIMTCSDLQLSHASQACLPSG